MSDPHTIDLSGKWRLSSERTASVVAELPGDNYSALLDAGIIPDPYYGCNEKLVQWPRDLAWTFERKFEVAPEVLARRSVFLNLDSIDTFGEVFVNGVSVGTGCNMFVRFRREVKPLLKAGTNTIRVVISPPGPEARKLAERQTLPLKEMYFASLPDINFIRKVQCHGGWDWGISLLVCGLYGGLYLEAADGCRVEHLYSEQRHEAGRVVLRAVAELEGGEGEVEFRFDGETRTVRGQGRAEVEFVVESPRLWFPNGYGEQPLYELSARIGARTVRRKVGLRTVEVVSEPDDDGTSLYFKVNGVPVFAKGADWIPCDAMPRRQTSEVYARLIGDAAAVGMNMLRVWGGGQYENDAFYDICDEKGIMVWQDLMFACMEYPSSPEFLDLVEPEVRYQVKRLRDHASIVLWCGDNEVAGLLRSEKADFARHAVNYDRLNRALARWVRESDPTRVFWPSSPANGVDDSGLGSFDSADKGDMHYWKVWHSGEPFEAYYTVRPRFCSEFGFQSFPALSTVERFGAVNVTDPVMDCHQKNRAGNAKIIGMFARYFKFPSSLAEFVYLSQVQQLLAIRTAVEFWRSLRPHCMGTLFWQFNDNWPVASWSSIDYHGNWKLLHYAAKRFYAPLLVTARRDGDAIGFFVVNDAQEVFSGTLTVERFSLAGEVLERNVASVAVPAGSAVKLDVRVSCGTPEEFLHYSLGDGEGEFFFADFKALPLPDPEIKTRRIDEFSWEFSADAPAFFVALDCDSPVVWSDNGFTLLPGRPRVIRRVRGADCEPRIFHLGMIR